MPITEAERQKRKGYIGSSDMAAILGSDKFRNAHDVFLDKTNRTEDLKPNEAMEAGTFFEAGVIDWAESRLGPLGRNVELVLNEFHLIDHLDGQVISSGDPVEAKTAGLFGPLVEDFGEEGSDHLPDRILVQCHCHMICSERDICHVPVFIGGRGFIMYEVKREQMIVDTICDAALDFWDCIENDTPPENITPSVEFIKRIKRVPKKVVGIEKKLIEEWQDAKDKVKWAEAVCDDAKAAMLNALGDAEAGKFVMDGRAMMLTYFEQSSHLIDSKRLREEKPEIAKEFTKISKCRVARLKKIKRGFVIPKL